MYKGRRLGLLPFFIVLSLLSFSQSKKIIFRGFVLQNPKHLLKSIHSGDISVLKKRLEQTGFFRQVFIEEKNESIVIAVKEYPRVKDVIIEGNTLYKKSELLDYLNIKTGYQFNSRKFQTGLQQFYQKCKDDGYTHFTVEKIKVSDRGRVDISISEGILKQVLVKNEGIKQNIIDYFFKDLINRPFNSHRAKYILEELLFTEAFYQIDSEVRRKDGLVYLYIKIDKKRIKRLKNILEYSSFGGFKLFNLTGLVKKNNHIQFMDARTEYFSHKESKLVHLNLDFSDFRRKIGKNLFSMQLDFFYTTFSGLKDLSLMVKPAYIFNFIKNISFSLYVNGGLNKNLSDRPNALIAEAGFDLVYTYRSSLDRTKFSIKGEYKTSLLENYTNIRLITSLHSQFSPGELRLYGQWSFFSGEAYGFNYNLIPFDQAGILTSDEIFSRDSLFITGQLNSKYFWGWFKMGILGQYFYNQQAKWLFGLNTTINIKSIPLNLILFWQDKKPQILARVILFF